MKTTFGRTELRKSILERIPKPAPRKIRTATAQCGKQLTFGSQAQRPYCADCEVIIKLRHDELGEKYSKKSLISALLVECRKA